MGRPAARQTLRVLGVIRLSNLTDATSSPERQREKVAGWAKLHDAVVVGNAEDLDVSAISVSPFKRPALKKWLDKPDEFDVIVAWKLDRLARKTRDFLDLLAWAETNKIRIVTVEESFDLGTAAGRMVATVLAAFAEYEGEVIKERAKQTYDHNIRAGKWRGGFIPYGYMATGNAGDYRLTPDPVTSEIMRDIVQRVIAGEPIAGITRDLNKRKIPTSLDVQRQQSGKEPKGALWRPTTLLKMLRSKTLLGYYEAEGSEYREGTRKVIKGEDGLPLQRAEPIITRADWDQLQTKLVQNARPGGGNRLGGSPLRQVAYCVVCGRPLYIVSSRVRYYRCSSVTTTGIACGNSALKASVLDEHLETRLLDLIGDQERMTTKYIPGSDHTEQLEQVKQAMDEARQAKAEGWDYDYSGGDQEYKQHMSKLSARRKELEALPVIPSRTELEGTGERFRDYWATLTPDEKGRFYRDNSIRVEVLRWPGSITPVDGPTAEPTASLAGATYVLDRAVRTSKPQTLIHVDLGDVETLYASASGQARSDETDRLARGALEAIGT